MNRPADEHAVRAMYRSNGIVRVRCGCDHLSLGSTYEIAKREHDTHVAETEPVEVEL